MPGCTVPYCSNSTQKGFKLFHFPADRERCARWVKNCRREEGWAPTRHTCICEVHFEESQFELHRADGLRKLKPFAVPTIFSDVIPTTYGRKKKSSSVPEKTTRNPGLQKKSRQTKKGKNATTKHSDVSQSASNTSKEPQSASEANTCFICNRRSQNIVPNDACTETSKTHLKHKLVQLVSVEFDLLVQDVGMICINCSQILNCIDYIENVHHTLSKGILNHVKQNFCMEPTEHVNLQLYMKSLKNLAVFYPWSDADESHHSWKQKENIMVTSEMQHSHPSDKSIEIADQFIESEEEDYNSENQESISVENRQETSKIVENFECEICSYATQYRSLMVYHLRQHFKNCYTCDFCSTPVDFHPSPAEEKQASGATCILGKDEVCPQLSKPQTDSQHHNSDGLEKNKTRKRKSVNAQDSCENVKQANISEKFDSQYLILNSNETQMNML